MHSAISYGRILVITLVTKDYNLVTDIDCNFVCSPPNFDRGEKMEKDRKTVLVKYRNGLASLFCVADYSILENASDKEKQKIIAHARKVRKIKSVSAPNLTHSGNPYIMLGRKINTKGKRVK